MATTVPFSKPVEDSVPKVDNAIAVGEDLEFQRRWWRFERIMWAIFAVIIVCDLLGLFGRGLLAKAERRTSDGTIDLKYERIERALTPSMMTFQFGPSAVHDGRIRLFVSEDVVRHLGAQRVSPQPAESVLGDGGITYTFPATDANSMVEIQLTPAESGPHKFTVGVPGSEPIAAQVLVLP